MIVIDDDDAVRYGRISGNDFIACNDDNCSHYDHGNTLAEHIAMMPISCLNAFPTGFMMTCMN